MFIGSRRVAKLSRRRRLAQEGGDTLYFIVHIGRRNSYLAPDGVPPFEGEEAWFELELVKGKPWSTWKVLRQVETINGRPKP